MKTIKSILIATSFALTLLVCGCLSSSVPTGAAARNKVDRVAYLSDIPPPCLCMERQIARFDIPLNYTTNGLWRAFELKATTNNYDHVYPEYYRLQYYAESEIAEVGRSIPQAIANWEQQHPGQSLPPKDSLEYLDILNESRDRMWLFTCTEFPTPGEHFNGDHRSYRFVKNLTHLGIGSNWPGRAFTVVVLVDLDALERHRDGCEEWMKVKDEELIWSWSRHLYSLDGHPIPEEEPGTEETLWRGITPTCWYSKMPEWAANQITNYWPRYRQSNYQATSL